MPLGTSSQNNFKIKEPQQLKLAFCFEFTWVDISSRLNKSEHIKFLLAWLLPPQVLIIILGKGNTNIFSTHSY